MFTLRASRALRIFRNVERVAAFRASSTTLVTLHPEMLVKHAAFDTQRRDGCRTEDSARVVTATPLADLAGRYVVLVGHGFSVNR